MLRPGKVDREIKVPALDETSRLSILTYLLKSVKHEESSVNEVNMLSAGYAASDLTALVSKVVDPKKRQLSSLLRD